MRRLPCSTSPKIPDLNTGPPRFCITQHVPRALQRASKRGLRKISYVGDFDPSGLLMEEVDAREMRIDVERVALTLEQIRGLRLPSVPVNRRDFRAKAYMEKFGDRAGKWKRLGQEHS